ncbi:MAG: fibronectin type III domain-containing protein, partial [Candidatus Diapherotrites archaeon]|nr:fibronectin type III domain-containing protein [Candidatus Diapherotrites archaeon]
MRWGIIFFLILSMVSVQAMLPAPEHVAAESLSSDSIRVSWDPVEGAVSYSVYRSLIFLVREGDLSVPFSIRHPTTTKISSGLSVTEYADTGLEDAKYYHYRIVAVDSSGESGAQSSIASAQTRSACDYAIDFSLSKTDQNVLVSLVPSADRFFRPVLEMVRPSGERKLIFDSNGSVSDITELVSLRGFADGNYSFQLSARDLELDSCVAQRDFFIDSIHPSVSVVSSLASPFAGVVDLNFLFSDAAPSSGFSRMEVYLDSVLISTVTDLQNGFVQVSWNSESHENGRFALKVLGYDGAGNEGEFNGALSILNTRLLESDANRSLGQALELSGWAVQQLGWLDRMHLDSARFRQALAAADANRLLAVSEFDRNADWEKARKLADGSLQQFLDLNQSVSLTPVGVLVRYPMDANQVELSFKRAGLKPVLVGPAVDAVRDFGVSRRFSLNEFRYFDSRKYLIEVQVFMNNAASTAKMVRVIESVPKAFAASMRVIDSNWAAVPVVDDPVFYADVNLAPSSLTVFRYFLSVPLSRSEADALLESVDSFDSLPVVVPAGTDVP